MSKPIDNSIRELAVSELERNIVVTAGAGTGKTTLLVERMLHVILGHKRFKNEESPIRRVMAMTFTEKAASEMKVRLMGELEKIVAVVNGKASQKDNTKVEKFLAHIRDTYQTTYREVERRARKSLEDMDKAIIGTIHGFAAYILRLYPIESNVVPGFVVDEGDFFDELFDKEWAKWLESELVLSSPHADSWKSVLRRLDLESLENLARRLSGFTIPLNSLTSGEFAQCQEANLREGGGKGVVINSRRIHSEINQLPLDADNKPGIQSLLDPVSHKILKILPCCEKPNNNLLSQLQELAKILDGIKKKGFSYLNKLEYDFDKETSKAKTGWTDDGFEIAQELTKECHILLKKLKTVDDAFVATVIGLISPFAKAFRQTYLSQGYVSFDGLLTLTRDLLQNKEYRYIREKLKKDFRTILVDEFQDTDPVQYEIVLFLSEALGHYSKDARKLTLEPGKLFIVGDPKQSIYAFRRADIEAYEQVVRQVCGQDETLKLQENFRSHSGIIEVVNRLFEGRIIVEKPGLQPCYIPIHANRLKKHHSQVVEIVLVSDKDGAELKADEAREAEAEWIARWIIKHINNEAIEDTSAENGLRKLKYRDIALLLRAFTQVRSYVEALKRYGIPYIVEGEKYFYTTQEILDFTNLLRIIENPHDTIALVGVMRSPLVGLTDREIYELLKNHLLDYRKDISGKTFESCWIMKSDGDTNHVSSPCEGVAGGMNNLFPAIKNIVEPFYKFLRKTHARAGILPVSQLIAEIMDNTHIAEITACAWHGEQKLANLQKFYQMACDMEQSDGISLKKFIARIKVRIKDAREEGESPLSDETLDVVKILTIHKSKGLEFPVVILGNLHGEVRNDKEVLDAAVFDWSTSTTGIVIGEGGQRVRNFQSVIIEKKLNDRSWEEEKRVLYVAMTRAKERLILTGSLKDDDKSYMGLITQSLRDAAGVELGDETFMNQGKFPFGNAEVFVEHFRFDGTHRPQTITKEKNLDIDWTAFIELWKKRKAAMIKATRNPLFVSPATIAFEEAMKKSLPAVPGRTERMPHLYPDEFEQHRARNYPVSPLYEGEEQGEVVKSKRIKADTNQSHQNHAAMIGSICHRVLEGWNFYGNPRELQMSVESAVRWAINRKVIEGESSAKFQRDGLTYQGESISPPSVGGDERVVIKYQEIPVEYIKAEVVKILSAFIGSEAYKELQAAQILGREVPILLNWCGQIMRGVIDIIYKKDGRIIIADYKTDHVSITDLPVMAGKYLYQKEIYIDAVKRSRHVNNQEFKLIFLRLGKAISL